jgi:hypothetical protein
MKGRHNFDPKSGESYEDTHPNAEVNSNGSKGVSSLVLIDDDYVITSSDDGTCVIWAIYEFMNKTNRDKRKSVKNLHDDIWPEPEEEARVTKDIPRARAVAVINKFNTGHRRNVGITCMALGFRGNKSKKKKLRRKAGNRRMRMSAASPKSRQAQVGTSSSYPLHHSFYQKRNAHLFLNIIALKYDTKILKCLALPHSKTQVCSEVQKRMNSTKMMSITTNLNFNRDQQYQVRQR